MGFTEAIQSGFDHYTKFDGRASRPAFWWWFLFTVLAGIAANIIGAIVGTQVIGYLVSLALFLPTLSVSIRRLHDTGRSGWWYLLIFIPILGWIALLIFYLQEGDDAPNEYGPPPAATAAA